MTKYLSVRSELPYDQPILSLLLGLEVVKKDGSLLRLLTPIFDYNARAVDNLACVSLAVQHTQTSPLAQLLSVRNLDQGDLVL